MGTKDTSEQIDEIESAIAAVRAGRMVVVVDDADRENEGDLIMAAEKVADHILGRALPPDHAAAAATWVDPEWRTRQRERPPMRRVWDGQF